jgi:hypothetical protein
MTEFELNRAGNSAAQQKLGAAFLFAQASTGLAWTGVLTGLTVAQTTTASGSVLISAGAGVVQSAVLDGASLLVNDTVKTLDIFTANPVGALPRNDIIVFDAVTATLAVIVGTPNVTPADPTTPATVLRRARLRHAASATTIPAAVIDQLGVPTGLAGTPIPVNTQGGRDLLTAVDGLQVYRLDTHTVETYQNGAWAVMANQVDTDWINAGFTAASGFTITSQVARRLNGVVSVQLNMVSISAKAAGNITNVAVVNIPVGWGPIQSNGHLGGGPTSGGHTSYASAAGTIVMTATDGGFAAGAGFYVLGMWML